MIEYKNYCPTPKEFNYLTDSVGWGMRDENVVKEGFYERFGFVARPNEDLGAGMILNK